MNRKLLMLVILSFILILATLTTACWPFGSPFVKPGKDAEAEDMVDDLIEGLLRLMNSDDSFTGPVNLGNPVELTILELANRIIESIGSKSEIIHEPLPEDDPRQRQPDIELAKAQLGWQPDITLEEGLKKTIDYFRTIV